MDASERNEAMEAAREALGRASQVLVVTGAGISAASGVPTFRGPGGLWEGFRPEDLATPEAFQRDPERVWRFYRWRLNALGTARPNAGHRALVDLEEKIAARGKRFLLVTQNVDGLHQDAGSRSVLPIHGDIRTARCTACGTRLPVRDAGPGPVPHCPSCGAIMRPDVLWFGEVYPEGVLERAFAWAAGSDVALVVGTSGMVWTPVELAREVDRAGGAVIEVNPEPTGISTFARWAIRGDAAAILPRLV